MLQAAQRKMEVSNLLSSVMPYRGETPVPNALFGTSLLDSHASANTEGTWETGVDPIPHDIEGIVLSLSSNTASRDFLVDIGVGPTGGGSEVVVVGNILFSAIPAGQNGHAMFLPLYLPASSGQRLSLRCQSSTGSSIVSATGHLCHQRSRQRPLRSVETFGADAADSGGGEIDPGASAGSKGLYTTLGTTTKAISELSLAFGNRNNTARTTATWLVDVAIGGSSTIIIGDIFLVASATNDMMFPQFYGPIPVEIPAGSDVKVRAQSSTNDGTDRLFDCVVYGFSEAE